MGVAEHIFDVNIHGKTVTWHLFDVGGARGQRQSWVPFFDDANAIIFVAPVSAFDQVRKVTYPLNVVSISISTSKKIPEPTVLMTLFSCSPRSVQISFSRVSISFFSSVRLSLQMPR